MRLLGCVPGTTPFCQKSLRRDASAGNIMLHKLDLSEVITNKLPYFR
jgi:hypothetical protein